MVLWHEHEYAITYEDVIWLDVLSIFDTKALLENEIFLLLILRRCCKKYWLMKLGFFRPSPKENGGRSAKAQFISDIPTIQHPCGA